MRTRTFSYKTHVHCTHKKRVDWTASVTKHLICVNRDVNDVVLPNCVRVCVYVYFLVPGLIYPLFRIKYYVCRWKKLKSSIKKRILIRTRAWNGSSNTAELNEKKIARARKSNMILRLMWQNDSGVKCEEVGWKLSIKKWKRKFLMNKCVCFFISFLFTFVI